MSPISIAPTPVGSGSWSTTSKGGSITESHFNKKGLAKRKYVEAAGY